MTTKEIERIILKDGWKCKNISKSSHRQYTHPIKKGRVTISYHHDKDVVPPKTLKRILRQAGLL
ncbi:type II toxin-antitoxin system HicA family toxin [Sneathia vaginalis]|uniref:type II toxin-antitoxin system HicA family toxin n=1 Tax=Sneathia vaginalis TaxID=187101 RepID=UPI0025943A10|nr:type II toxin-antitoxin system HicA family toxin [Sneathia vaginalis]